MHVGQKSGGIPVNDGTTPQPSIHQTFNGRNYTAIFFGKPNNQTLFISTCYQLRNSRQWVYLEGKSNKINTSAREVDQINTSAREADHKSRHLRKKGREAVRNKGNPTSARKGGAHVPAPPQGRRVR